MTHPVAADRIRSITNERARHREQRSVRVHNGLFGLDKVQMMFLFQVDKLSSMKWGWATGSDGVANLEASLRKL